MTAFNKVLEVIKNSTQYGHALINAQNRESLRAAKKEIENILGG